MIKIILEQQVVRTKNEFRLKLYRDNNLLQNSILNISVVSDINAFLEKLIALLSITNKPETISYQVLHLPTIN